MLTTNLFSFWDQHFSSSRSAVRRESHWRTEKSQITFKWWPSLQCTEFRWNRRLMACLWKLSAVKSNQG